MTPHKGLSRADTADDADALEVDAAALFGKRDAWRVEIHEVLKTSVNAVLRGQPPGNLGSGLTVAASFSHCGFHCVRDDARLHPGRA
jgi:hypothetical protein